MKRIGFISLIMLAIFVQLLVPNDTAFGEGVVAKTSPPPPDISLFTVFDPNFSYLNQGHAYITNEGDLKVNISGDSTAVKRVDKVGIQLTLQRWTGSIWINVVTSSSTYETDSTSTYASYSGLSVMSGYYYRTKSYHWIEEGSTVESGTRYSSSILIN